MDERDLGAVGTTRTARLMMSLETILFEIGKMDRELVEAGPADIDVSAPRELRWRIAGLSTGANELMVWLSEARLETIIH